MFIANPALVEQEAYVPGLTREYVSETYGIPLDDVAKLGSAENPFGPSPKAVAAFHEAAARLDLYPEWTARSLREKIGQKYGLDPEHVVCGCGETEIISWIIRVFAAPGDALLMHAPCFPIYHLTGLGEGRVPKFVPMGPDFEFRFDDFVAAITDEVRVVFLTNPHSPTGLLMEEADIRRVCEAAAGKLVVLDEAYVHFTETPGGFDLLQDYPHLIVLRTFSKAFGLAGLRVGFGVAQPEIVRPLRNIKPTWNLGQAQVAGAIAALDDDAHVTKTVEAIVEMRGYVAQRLEGLNKFRMVREPRSNFFTLRILDEGLTSTQAFDRLLERGVIVKDGTVSFIGYGDKHLRIDVNLKKHMDRLVWALGEI
jgi:histidinol-phosphate aminotransferase